MKSVLNYTATVLGCDIVRRITALSMLPKWQLQQLMENDKKQLNDRLLAEEPGPVPQPEPKPSMQCAWCGAPTSDGKEYCSRRCRRE